MNFLKNIFKKESFNFQSLMENGAILVDVRSPGEYSQGHIQGSINIPLDKISGLPKPLTDKKKTIITCCASGMRSGSAKNILESNGFLKVINGGSWISLEKKIQA